MRKLILIFLILTLSMQGQQNYTIKSQIKTQKSVRENELNPKNIYAIDIQRISTNRYPQLQKCFVQPKQIKSDSQLEKFRIGTIKGKGSVYESLTQLQDRQDGIDTFKILGEHIIIIMMNGSAFFLQNNKTPQKNLNPVDIKIKINYDKFKLIPHIAPIDGNAFIATTRQVSFCQPKLNSCTKIQGYKGADNIVKISAFQYNKKTYLFILAGQSLIAYQVSQNGSLLKQKVFSKQFFNQQRIFLSQIMPLSGNKLLLLDFYSGLIEIQYNDDSMINFKKQTKILYSQYGCRHFSHSTRGDYLTLLCSLTQKTYFILQLNRPEGQSTEYVAQQPLFFNEVLLGIDTNSQIIIAKILSGVRLFWASTQIQNPYPYDYQTAGSIFLHNAKASQLWTLNDRKVIYICTEDELRLYQLTVKRPKVSCFSTIQIKQEYKLRYTYQCQNTSLTNQKICTAQKRLVYETYQVKQVEFKTTLLPLTVSSILVLVVLLLLYKVSKKYDQQKQIARQKYNIQSDQFGLEGN